MIIDFYSYTGLVTVKTFITITKIAPHFCGICLGVGLMFASLTNLNIPLSSMFKAKCFINLWFNPTLMLLGLNQSLETHLSSVILSNQNQAWLNWNATGWELQKNKEIVDYSEKDIKIYLYRKSDHFGSLILFLFILKYVVCLNQRKTCFWWSCFEQEETDWINRINLYKQFSLPFVCIVKLKSTWIVY